MRGKAKKNNTCGSRQNLAEKLALWCKFLKKIKAGRIMFSWLHKYTSGCRQSMNEMIMKCINSILLKKIMIYYKCSVSWDSFLSKINHVSSVPYLLAWINNGKIQHLKSIIKNNILVTVGPILYLNIKSTDVLYFWISNVQCDFSTIFRNEYEIYFIFNIVEKLKLWPKYSEI